MKLEEVLDVISGYADEPTREAIDRELADAGSDASMIIERIRSRLAGLRRIDWRAMDEGDGWAEFVDAVEGHPGERAGHGQEHGRTTRGDPRSLPRGD
jgi:hypothetical protein